MKYPTQAAEVWWHPCKKDPLYLKKRLMNSNVCSFISKSRKNPLRQRSSRRLILGERPDLAAPVRLAGPWTMPRSTSSNLSRKVGPPASRATWRSSGSGAGLARGSSLCCSQQKPYGLASEAGSGRLCCLLCLPLAPADFFIAELRSRLSAFFFGEGRVRRLTF